MEVFLEEPKANACDVCYQRTFAAGPASVAASVRWLAKFTAESAQEADVATLPGGGEGLALASAQPHCEEVHCEAPIQRDIVPHLQQAATTAIGRVFEAAWLHSPEIQAALCQIALNEAARTTYVPETGEIALGAFGTHAAIVANNLLWQVNPSSQPLPNVPAGLIPVSSALSLDAMERTLKEAGSDDSPTGSVEISSGDLLALHVLCRGLDRVLDFASKYVPPPPVRQKQRGSLTWVWVAATCAAAMIVLAIGARSFVPLIGLAACVVFGLLAWEKSMVVIEIPAAVLEWPQRLNECAGDPSYQQILNQLRSCDLIAHATRFCAGTPVAEPARFAGVLRAIWLAPGRSLLLPRLVHELGKPLAADGDGALRLSILGEELLAQDFRGEGRALVAGVAAELTAAKATETISWGVLCAEGPLEYGEGKRDASAPRFIAALLRRAAALQAVCLRRSTLDQQFLTSCDEAAQRFMGQLAIGESDSATMFVKCLDYLTRGGISNAIFTPGSGCTVEEMLRRTEEIWKDHERLPDDSVRGICETVLDRLGSLQLAKARMPDNGRLVQSRSSPPGALDHLCVERLFRIFASGGAGRPASPPAPFVGDWWHAPPGPRGLEGSSPVAGNPPLPRKRPGWHLKLEDLNLRKWQQSGFPQRWVEAHHYRWNDADWRALLKELERSEFWPMVPDAIGMVLEGLKIIPIAPRELTLEDRNLRRWEESGSAENWVKARHGKWDDADWLALLKSLERSVFWPMNQDGIGMLLEWLKRKYFGPPPPDDGDNAGAPLGVPVPLSGPQGPARPGAPQAEIPPRPPMPRSVPIARPPVGGRPPRPKLKNRRT
jgi:hypothetical protein